MITEDFNKIVDERISKIKLILANKAKEYAKGDRLHNFKVAARIRNETPEQSLWGMAMKHLVSVIDIIDDAKTQTYYSDNVDLIEEKISDLINYLILLEGLLKERVAK